MPKPDYDKIYWLEMETWGETWVPMEKLSSRLVIQIMMTAEYAKLVEMEIRRQNAERDNSSN